MLENLLFDEEILDRVTILQFTSDRLMRQAYRRLCRRAARTDWRLSVNRRYPDKSRSAWARISSFASYVHCTATIMRLMRKVNEPDLSFSPGIGPLQCPD
jgi:hypothetical protein